MQRDKHADHPHAAFAAAGAEPNILAGQIQDQFRGRLGSSALNFRIKTDEFAATREAGFLASIGEEAEVAHAHEGYRYGVKEEAADEFMGRQRHRLAFIGIAPIPIGEPPDGRLCPAWCPPGIPGRQTRPSQVKVR